MIDGITVLNTYTECFPLLGIILVSIIVGLVCGAFSCLSTFDSGISLFICMSILGAVFLFLVLGFSYGWGKKTTMYEVLIDDSVSWQDVEDNYNVEDVDGEIVTISIKEDK